MNERNVLYFEVILVAIKWIAIITFWNNVDTLANVGFLLAAYSSNTSNYELWLVLLTEVIYTLPHFLFAWMIFQKRYERHPSYSSMTLYSELFIVRFVIINVNYAVFYFEFVRFEFISYNFLLYVLLALSIPILSLLMIIPLFRLPSSSLFRKIKISFTFWLVIPILMNFSGGTLVGNSFYPTSSLILGISSVLELVFLYFIAQFLHAERYVVFSVDTLYPNSEGIVDPGNETEDLIKKQQYSHTNE